MDSKSRAEVEKWILPAFSRKMDSLRADDGCVQTKVKPIHFLQYFKADKFKFHRRWFFTAIFIGVNKL